jgi:hypothetical protein
MTETFRTYDYFNPEQLVRRRTATRKGELTAGAKRLIQAGQGRAKVAGQDRAKATSPPEPRPYQKIVTAMLAREQDLTLSTARANMTRAELAEAKANYIARYGR